MVSACMAPVLSLCSSHVPRIRLYTHQHTLSGKDPKIMYLGSAIGRWLARLFGGSVVGHSLPDSKVQVWLVRRLMPKWAAGQAWGNVILLQQTAWKTSHTDSLLRHEYRHVLQWRRYGSLFLLLYPFCSLWATVRHGPRMAYWMNRFEREARGEITPQGLATARRIDTVESEGNER